MMEGGWTRVLQACWHRGGGSRAKHVSKANQVHYIRVRGVGLKVYILAQYLSVT